MPSDIYRRSLRQPFSFGDLCRDRAFHTFDYRGETARALVAPSSLVSAASASLTAVRSSARVGQRASVEDRRWSTLRAIACAHFEQLLWSAASVMGSRAQSFQPIAT